MHPGAQRKLAALGISTRGKYALQLSRQDYAKYDYLIGMTARNVQNMRRILGSDPDHKLHRLLDFTPRPRDIADPWYTGDFDMAYQDIAQGCRALLAHLQACLLYTSRCV